MGFLFDGLDAEAYDRAYDDRQLIRRVIGYFAKQRGKIILVSVTVFVGAILNTALPVVISQGLDRLQVDRANETIITYGVLAAVLGGLGWLFNFIRRWLSAEAVGDVVLKLREDAFDAVMKRDLSFYDQFPSGKIVSRVTSDSQAFSTVVTLAIDLISQVLIVLFLLGYLFTVDVSLTVTLILISPLIIGAALLSAASRVSASVTHAESAPKSVRLFKRRSAVSALPRPSVRKKLFIKISCG